MPTCMSHWHVPLACVLRWGPSGSCRPQADSVSDTSACQVEFSWPGELLLIHQCTKYCCHFVSPSKDLGHHLPAALTPPLPPAADFQLMATFPLAPLGPARRCLSHPATHAFPFLSCGFPITLPSRISSEWKVSGKHPPSCC